MVIKFVILIVFFYKQSTAYKLRISDWSSDVCSSVLDLLAVHARDPGMVLDPLGLKPLLGHPRRRRPDLVLGFKVDALRLQRPVIYAGVYIQLGQPLVDMIGPGHAPFLQQRRAVRSEEHTSELQSLMRISYAVFCLKKKKTTIHNTK